MSSKALEPFVDMAFSGTDLERVEYKDGRKKAFGYRADILPKVCEVWLKAREAKVLQSQQLPKAQQGHVSHSLPVGFQM